MDEKQKDGIDIKDLSLGQVLKSISKLKISSIFWLIGILVASHSASYIIGRKICKAEQLFSEFKQLKDLPISDKGETENTKDVSTKDVFLNKAFLLGYQSAIALALSNQDDDASAELIMVNEWLKDLSISYEVETEDFKETDLQNIINYINPKGEALLYSYLIGFYSVVCDNTPAQCHQDFNLGNWLTKSKLETTGYKGSTNNLSAFLEEMEEHCRLKMNEQSTTKSKLH